MLFKVFSIPFRRDREDTLPVLCKLQLINNNSMFFTSFYSCLFLTPPCGPMLVAIQMACSPQYSLIEDIYNRALNMNTYGIENMFYGFVKMGFKNPTMCVYIVSAV